MRSVLMMLAAALPGLACSCASYEKVLACEIFHKAPIIFRGKVVDHNHDPRLGFVQWTLYRFRIEEMFKGLPSSVKEVFIDPASFTSCYGEFHSNADYLIYTGGQESLETFSTYYSRVKSVKNRDGSVKPLPDAWKDLGDVPVFPVGLCSPSGTIQDDDPDLTYLRLASQGKLSASGSIQGIAAQNAGSAFLFGDHLPVAGATITATKGSYTWNSITAADGSYSIPQLPPGKYTLSAASADFGVGDFKLRAPDVEVVAGGCVVARASFGTSATITGTVLNHQGRAATGVYIQAAAVSANGTVKIIPETWARSDLRGEFTVRNVPAGEIVVGANINSSPTFEEPYDTVYVPAAASVDAARVFTLKPDDQVKGVILRLPQPLPFANLFVDVLWLDGSPATAGARAFAEWNGRRSALERAPVEGNRVRLPLALG